MTSSDAGKKPVSGKTPASRKPGAELGAELKDNELDQVSGGVALAKPTKKPDKVINDDWP